MDVRIRERLVGALVLVAVIVLIVPALLKGPGTAPGPPAAGTRSVEILLLDPAAPEAAERLVPEPEIARNAAAMPGQTPSAAAAVEPPPRVAEPAAAAGAAAPAADSAAAAAVLAAAWAVQLGAFSSRTKADKLVATLRARGYAAFVLEYRAGGQVLHRVRVGPEQDRARATAVAERLRKDGFKPLVAPHP